MDELSVAEARRIALHALGFTGRRPAKPGLAHLRKLADRLNAIQIDSVNVLARAHYLPAYSRLGPYPVEALDALAYRKREIFEYWGHQASFVPARLYPLFRWRMEARATGRWQVSADGARFVERVLAEVAERGPISAAELSDPGRAGNGPWWGWGEGKWALEWLFGAGRVAVAGRRNFERLYDLPERVLPAEVLGATPPEPDEARKQLLVLGAGTLGVATARDLENYFHVDASYERPMLDGRPGPPRLKRLVAELVEEGRLREARVEGWKDPAYLHPEAKSPRSVDARTLVSPFDPLVWERRRTRRLFGFDYTIEIYVPAPKRVYGYYVLPFLRGDRIVARVDLKADRKMGALRVPGAFAEDGDTKLAADLADELRRLAGWLELERIEVGRRGDLTRPLRAATRQFPQG